MITLPFGGPLEVGNNLTIEDDSIPSALRWCINSTGAIVAGVTQT